MDLPPPNLSTPEEYLSFERNHPWKWEWRRGRVQEMPHPSLSHLRLVSAVGCGLSLALRDTPFWVLMSRMRVKVPATGFYTFPDIVVTASDATEDEFDDTLLDADALFEVVSPTSLADDAGFRFDQLRQLPSLRDYVLIAEDHVWLEHRQRVGQSQNWIQRRLTHAEANLDLPSLSISLPIARFYERIQF